MEYENITSAKLSRHKIPTTVFLATRNKHKTKEIQAILGNDFTVNDATQVEGLPEIDESGTTFEENSKLKAEGISHHINGIVLADDSGLEVDALDKAPGVFSARYAGIECNDDENTALVLEKMRGYSNELRSARFRCVLAVAERGVTIAVFEGAVEGILASERRGDGGFGYDPIFMPLGYNMTFGELSADIKNALSHRSRALLKFKDWLLKYTGR